MSAAPADDGLREPDAAPIDDNPGLRLALEGPDWSSGRRRVRRRTTSGRGAGRRSRRRRRIRRILLGSGILVVLIGAALAWLVYSGLRAKHDLEAVRNGVRELRQQISAGDLDGARTTARAITARAHDAHDQTTGPLWALASSFPRIGSPLDTARTVTTSVDLLAGHALGSLIDASDGLRPSSLRQPDGSFDLGPLEALAPRITHAQGVLSQALRQLRAASGSTWLGSINAARSQLITEVSQLQPTLASARRAAVMVPGLLGADGPKTYLLAFESDAEMRATGGIPGTFAILRVDHGRMKFTRFEPDGYLVGLQATDLNFGRSYAMLFQAARADFRDSNYSPNFPYAAKIWSAMWKQRTGQTLDGALAIDPTALSYLLGATGPVTLQDGSRLTADNVVQLTQNTLYYRYPNANQNAARKQYLVDLARTVSEHLLDSRTDVTTLIKAAGRGASEHRLLLWSGDASLEKQLADVPLGGTVPSTGDHPFLGVALDNNSQSKLDYWMHAKVTWARTTCGPTSDVTVTIELTNDAPAGASLPDYVAGNSYPRGGNNVDVVVYGSVGGQIVSRTVDGKRPFYVPGTDLNHPVNLVETPVPHGHTATVVLHLKEPFRKGPPDLREQPMINPMQVSIQDACT